MSHIESVNVTITDLAALKDACTALGVDFVEHKKTYNWFGQSVGDYPLPKGFKKEDLGQCDHVIRVPGVNYEVGVVPARNADGTAAKGYTLLYDFWGHSGMHDGQKLKAKFSTGLTKLVDAYSLAALKRKASAKGLLTTTKVVDGKVHLTVRGF
jgi:hypothetical protein